MLFFSAAIADSGASKQVQVTPDQAISLIGQGDAKTVAKLARERSNSDPHSAVWHEVIALAHVHQQQFIEEVVQTSISESRRAAELAPRDARVLATRSIIQFLLKEYSDAIKSAKIAVQLQPENRRAKMVLLASKMLEKLANSKSSITSTWSKNDDGKEEVLRLCSAAGNEFDVYSVAIRYFRIRLDPDGVNKVFDMWLKNMPKSSYAYYRRGQFEEAQRDFVHALGYYEKATALNARYVTPLARMAYCQYKLKRYEDALKTYKSLERVNGFSNSARYLHRAQCYAALGKYHMAVKDYNAAIEGELGSADSVKQLEEAKKRDPKTRKVLRSWLDMRAEAYEKLGNLESAVTDAKLGVMVSPGDPAALNFRRKLYERHNQLELALKDLNFLVQLNPTAASWYEARAAVLERLGRKADAQNDLKRYDSLRKHGTLK